MGKRLVEQFASVHRNFQGAAVGYLEALNCMCICRHQVMHQSFVEGNCGRILFLFPRFLIAVLNRGGNTDPRNGFLRVPYDDHHVFGLNDLLGLLAHGLVESLVD